MNLVGARGGDYDGLVTAIAAWKTAGRTLAYLGLLGVAATDIYFDWDRIRCHFLLMNTGERPDQEAPSWGFRLGPGIGGEVIGMSLHWRR